MPAGQLQRHELPRAATLLELRSLVLQQEQQWQVGAAAAAPSQTMHVVCPKLTAECMRSAL